MSNQDHISICIFSVKLYYYKDIITHHASLLSSCLTPKTAASVVKTFTAKLFIREGKKVVIKSVYGLHKTGWHGCYFARWKPAFVFALVPVLNKCFEYQSATVLSGHMLKNFNLESSLPGCAWFSPSSQFHMLLPGLTHP